MGAPSRGKRSAFEGAAILLRLILFRLFTSADCTSLYSGIALPILRPAEKIRFHCLKIRLDLFECSILLLPYFSTICSS